MQSKLEFVQTIKQHQGIIYKVVRVYEAKAEDQKDLYQEIVYQLWKSFSSFQGKSKMSTWIYRVALNTAIAHLNKSKRLDKRVEMDFSQLNIAEERDPLLEERMALMYEHIYKLDVIEKGLILLYLEGKNYEEIAKITGFTKTNVGTRLGRIKEKIRNNVIK